MFTPKRKPVFPAVFDRGHALSKGLIGFWPLNEGVGITAFDLVRGRHGTLTDGPVWGTGKFGSDISFDGTNDYITGSFPNGDVPLTLCAWFKVNSGDQIFLNTGQLTGVFGLRSAAANYEAYGLGLINSGANVAVAFAYQIDNTAGNAARCEGTTNLWNEAGNWHFLTGVFRSTTSTDIYLDGVFQANANLGKDSQTSQFFMGAMARSNPTGFLNFFNGHVDLCRVYDRVLSAGEIRQLYLNPLAGITVPQRNFSASVAAPPAGTARNFGYVLG